MTKATIYRRLLYNLSLFYEEPRYDYAHCPEGWCIDCVKNAVDQATQQNQTLLRGVEEAIEILSGAPKRPLKGSGLVGNEAELRLKASIHFKHFF